MSQQQNASITEQREELMIVSTNNNQKVHQKRLAHFIKPTLHPTNQPFPKPPSLPPSSNPNFKLLKRFVSFMGRPIPQKGWNIWVQNLQQIHQKTWQKAGIFHAIKASTYTIKRDNELILKLAQNWSPETNTFIFPWGECSITLEDVMILEGFSVLGDCVKSPLDNTECVELGNEMIKFFYKKRKKSQKGFPLQHTEWMEFYMGFGGEVEHRAFLTLWLSRYVFSTNHYNKISYVVMPIAIALSNGTRLALANAVLGSIYKDLSLLQEKVLGCMHELTTKEVVLWAPFQLVQVWAWERFPTLGRIPGCLRSGEVRLARWDQLLKPKRGCFLDSSMCFGENFIWRPYALFVENWEFPEFYGDQERLMLIGSEVGEEILSFAKCLQACELVGLDCSEQYLPHRVGLQFGMDQDIPGSMPRFTDVPVEGVKLHLPPRSFKGDVTARYYDWFRDALSPEISNTRFGCNQDESVPRKVTRASMKDNKSCLTDLTSLYDVPIASYGAGVEKNIEVTAYFDSNGIPNNPKLIKNCDVGPSCLISPFDGAKSSSTVNETCQSSHIAVGADGDGNADSVAENSKKCSDMSGMRCFPETFQCCDIEIVCPSFQCHDNSSDAILSQRVLNEVQLAEPEIENMEIHECQAEIPRETNKGKDKEEIPNKSLAYSDPIVCELDPVQEMAVGCENMKQGNGSYSDPIVCEQVDVQEMTVECKNMKLGNGSYSDPIVCKQIDVQEMAVECENMKQGNGSYSDPIICEEDDDVDDNGFDVDKLFSFPELEARISNLQRVVSEMKAARS